tara:strand:+ start:105 stop:803 length:699 start_codon:yes stop_codon:yes gene_type:complete
MSSKPKKSEYQPSAAEKASAAVALAENKYFKQKYDPLLQKMRDTSTNDNSVETLRGRANADTMQTLAGKASYDRAATGANGGAEAQAYQAQLGLADKAGLERKNNMQLGVLGTARGQAADATTGMTAAANMGASRVLTQAKAKQEVRSAKFGALAEAGTAFVIQGAKNMKSEGQRQKTDANGNKMTKAGPDGNQVPDMETVKGSFTSPVDGAGNKVSGLGNRLSYSNAFSTY